ncbi:MAG TPA: TIGR00266 family protein [Spirochaetota bacterium]|nr:TIGR00266 family protein [Spirochaetota bacterium]
MQCQEIDYEIKGSDMQLVRVELDPGETVLAEAGAMTYMEEGITFTTKMGDGSQPGQGMVAKLFSAGKRVISGESLFLTHFSNSSNVKKSVSFAAPYPGKIIAADMSAHGNTLLCQKDSFLCAALGTRLDLALHKRLGAGLFGGEGFILEKLSGDGLVFLHAGGTLIEKKLQGEMLKVDTGCLVAFTTGIDYDISRAGGLKNMLFGGEGLFLTTLKGHGTVWLQSLPFSRMADRIIASAPSAGGRSKGEGSILGGLGRMLDGDN